jgi:hypothetical protein
LVGRRSQQRAQPIEHFFRQLSTAEGVPDGLSSAGWLMK